MEDMLYVALGDNVKYNKSILIWALQNSGGKKICIIHINQPATVIPLMGTKFPASSMKEKELRAYRELERQNKQKILDEYCRICGKMGVRPEVIHADMYCIEMGIVEQISQHGIRKLVMGAAADKHYSKKMTDLKSKKAIYVRLRAPRSCCIQFICKGYLINTREGILDETDVEVRSSQNTKPESSDHFTVQCGGQNLGASPSNSVQVSIWGESITEVSSLDGTEDPSTPWRRSDALGDPDGYVESSTRYGPGSSYSTCSSSGAVDISRIPSIRSWGSDNQSAENLHHPSSPSVLEGSIDDTLYAKLEQAMAEAANARREVFQEAERCGKAKKDAIEAMRRTQVSESLYAEEVKQRKETQEALAQEQEEHQKVINQLNQVIEELQNALDKQSSLESQIAESDEMVKGLELRIASAMELLQAYKQERDEFQEELDIAQKESEEVRRKLGEASSTKTPQFFSQLSFSDIEEATQNLDPSLKIGEGRHGSIYKGLLRQTQVAIKLLHHHNLKDPSGLQHEVDTLRKLRHPNLVTLIGFCEEAQALIYEYLPNGTLEDRLCCKDNTPPLPWQTRICIATDLCLALIFLHSYTPVSILHGDLTPAKVLLDANFISKLSDFGNCPAPSHDQSLKDNNITLCLRTELKGSTFAYLDPEFLLTGELTLKSDVYSFGIILLQLLTGRPPLGIRKEVQFALDAGKFKALLDPLAGDWPFEQAGQLADLALRCCQMYRTNRPDLTSDVWTVLEPMRVSYGGSYLSQLSYEELSEPPSYFLCPIYQEVMQNPHVAADGFTYELKALREWFDGGHTTSPMTNLKLEHCNLLPNHALRSAIQEWQPRH